MTTAHLEQAALAIYIIMYGDDDHAKSCAGACDECKKPARAVLEQVATWHMQNVGVSIDAVRDFRRDFGLDASD